MDYRPEDDVAYVPEARVPWRATKLTKETARLFNAASFVLWWYGAFFSTHITITFRQLGIEDHREAARLMAPFNKEMTRWRSVGPRITSGRWKKRARSEFDWPFLWLYVFENSRYQGFHVHQLCVVPRDQSNAFAEHVRAWWARAAMLDVPTDAIKVQQARTMSTSAGLPRHWAWIRYVLKTADREVGWVDAEGQWAPLGKIFGLRPYWATKPTYAPQLYGICHALSETAQTKAGFVSMLSQGRYADLYSGWEIDAFWRRRLGTD